MVNAKFAVGNKILKIGRWYTAVMMMLCSIASITFTILSYTLPKNGAVIYPLLWTGIGFLVSVFFFWVLKYLIYGFGLMVCDSAYKLSQKRVVTYLDYIEAKRKHGLYKINDEQMEECETAYYTNESGLIEKE